VESLSLNCESTDVSHFHVDFWKDMAMKLDIMTMVLSVSEC
jgi:hypothetical protein